MQAADLDPRPIDAFDAEHHVPSDWTHEPSMAPTRFSVKRSRNTLTNIVLRRLAVLLASLVFTGALVAATSDAQPELKGLTAPVALVFALIAFLAGASVVSAARAAVFGVEFGVDAARNIWTGPSQSVWPWVQPELHDSLGDVAAIAVRIFRDPVRLGALARAVIVFELKNGTLIEGPDAQSPDPQWADARARLTPLAREFARAAQKPLRVVDVASTTVFDVPL